MKTAYSQQQKLLDDFNLSAKTRELTIFILSDLHFKFGDDETKQDKDWREANEKAMVDFFKGWDKEKIDIIAVAGDLSSFGRAGGYRTFIDFLAKLKALPCFSYAVCFTCPGNHDIDRKYKTGRINKNFKQALMPLLQHPASVKQLFFDSFTKEALADLIFTSIKNIPKTKHSQFFKKLSVFENQLFRTYLKNTSEHLGDCMNEKFKDSIMALKDIRTVYMSRILGIDLLSVNSAWFCGLFNRDKEKLFLLNPVIDALVDHREKEAFERKHRSVTLTLMHHPYSWLHENEYNSTNNDDQAFTKLSMQTDIFISGHEHGDFKKPHTFNDESHIIVNGCSFSAELTPEQKCWPSTFGILKVRKIANDFSLERYRIKKIKKGKWDWVPAGTEEPVKYLRPKNKWNFEIDKELIFQQTECISFIKAHILQGVPEEEMIPMLLVKQLKSFHKIETDLNELSGYGYCGKDKAGNWIIIVPIDIIMAPAFKPLDLPALITGVKGSDKITYFAFIKEGNYSERSGLLTNYEGFKGWLKEKNNYFGQALPVLFSNKIFIV